ncbi:MAG: sigma-70 family RNA polymerase sigma factor [Prevotellaceae bacterium]|jgi:RNA polymerase sigma factor, sigma-70 family|nr:sigma-70 family RNA polymerase sigma factor [Prevotellaceae bacterium]
MDSKNRMTDDALVKAYIGGDAEAFDCLLARHQDRLFQHIFYAVHDEDLANDIFQETFVKVILSLRKGNYVEQGQFFAWLSRIAHNLVLDHFKTQRGQCSYDEDGQEFADETTSQLACVGREEEMIRMESIEMVQKWITLLPDEQREVVKMRFYQEIPFKEIAEKTGVGISTSLARMRYALLNLRKMATRAGMLK